MVGGARWAQGARRAESSELALDAFGWEHGGRSNLERCALGNLKKSALGNLERSALGNFLCWL